MIWHDDYFYKGVIPCICIIIIIIIFLFTAPLVSDCKLPS